MEKMKKQVCKRRLISYWATAVLLLLSYFFLYNINWQGSVHLHALMELASGIVALIVGLMALVRFFSQTSLQINNTFLIIGTGFIGTASLEIYHAVVTSILFVGSVSKNIPALVSWSWFSSRLLLSIIILASYLVWRYENSAEAISDKLQPKTIISTITLTTIVIFLFFVVTPLPVAFYPDLFLAHPEGLIPAIFFGLALFGYLKKGWCEHNAFEHWLVLAILINLLNQVLFISFSNEQYGLPSSAAHVLKIISYLTVLIGLFISMFGSFRKLNNEIDKAKFSESVLKKSEMYQKAIVDNVVDGLITINPIGIVLSFNKAAERIFKYDAVEVIGQNIKMLMPAPYSRQHDGYLENYATSGLRKIIGIGREVIGLCKDGSTFPMDLAVSKVDVADGTVYLGIVRDISELKKREKDLTTAKEASEVANQAKSEFLANMNREIRTPLNGVVSMIELALGTSLDEKQRRYLTVANQSSELLLNVINDILDFSKIEVKKLDLDPQLFSLRNIIEGTASTISVRAYDKGLELICSIAQELPDFVIGDNTRLQQVIINLLDNAIKFMEGGEILLKAELAGEQPSDDITMVHFSVQASGIGIDKDKQKKIFEAFSQSDASMTRHYGGTGLGLSISYQLVNLMGGEMWLDSELGKGSIFHFTVALEKNKNVTPNKAKSLEGIKGSKVLIVDGNVINRIDGFLEKTVQQSGLLEKLESLDSNTEERIEELKTKTTYTLSPNIQILLAEGNLVNQEVARGLLGKHGMTDITVVGNGLKAVEAYQQHKFDVILMDIRMPDMDGLQASIAIREIEKETGEYIPIVALIAQTMKEDIDECLSSGMDYYITKPIKSDELFSILTKIAPLEGSSKEVATEEQNKLKPKNALAFNLEGALASVGGNMGILCRVIEVFLNTSEKLQEGVRMAVKAGDANALHNTAHTIKGSVSNFGAKKAVDVAFQLEQMGRNNSMLGCDTLLKELESAMSHLEADLRNFKDEKSS